MFIELVSLLQVLFGLLNWTGRARSLLFSGPVPTAPVDPPLGLASPGSGSEDDEVRRCLVCFVLLVDDFCLW